MSNTASCATCQAIVPIVQRMAGKAIGATFGSLFGTGKKPSFWRALAGAAVVGLLGHAVDSALGAVCGKCGASIPETITA